LLFGAALFLTRGFLALVLARDVLQGPRRATKEEDREGGLPRRLAMGVGVRPGSVGQLSLEEDGRSFRIPLARAELLGAEEQTRPLHGIEIVVIHGAVRDERVLVADRLVDKGVSGRAEV